jgi:hypothetical protein
MVIPVEYSAIAGGCGVRSLGCSAWNGLAFSRRVRPLEDAISACASGRLAKIGTSDMDSVPPTIATSASPSAMALAASMKVWIDVAHARAAVCASILRGRPAASTTSRAMLGAVTVGITWPNTTWSISSGSSSARSTSSRTTIVPRSSAVSSPNTVPAFMNGVRSPFTTATRRQFLGVLDIPLSFAGNLTRTTRRINHVPLHPRFSGAATSTRALTSPRSRSVARTRSRTGRRRERASAPRLQAWPRRRSPARWTASTSALACSGSVGGRIP